MVKISIFSPSREFNKERVLLSNNPVQKNGKAKSDENLTPANFSHEGIRLL